MQQKNTIEDNRKDFMRIDLEQEYSESMQTLKKIKELLENRLEILNKKRGVQNG